MEMDERARFEARRKKILDNAGARLLKISGRAQHVKIGPVQNHSIEPELESNHSETNHFQNHESHSEVEPETEKENCIDGCDFTNKTDFNIRTSFINHEPPVPDQMFELNQDQNIASRKSGQIWSDYIIFVCLAIIIRTSYIFGFSWTFGENMIVPFVVVGLPRVALFTTYQQDEAMAFMLLRLTRIPQNRVNILSTVYLFFRHLLILLSIYVFTFVIFHCLLTSSVS